MADENQPNLLRCGDNLAIVHHYTGDESSNRS